MIDDEVAQLIDTITHSEDEKKKTQAIEILLRIGGKRAVPSLIGVLHDPNPQIRRWAATALGRLKDERAVEMLIEALQDKEDYVFTCAAVALGEIGDERAATPLISLSEFNKDPYFHGAVIVALEKIYQQRSLQSRLLFLDNDHSVVREYALYILATLPPKTALYILIEIHALYLFVYTLTDPSYIVRNKALKILEEILKDNDSLDNLLSVLESSDDKEVWAAIVLLGRKGDPRAIDNLYRFVQENNRKTRRGNRVIYLKTTASQALKHIEKIRQL